MIDMHAHWRPAEVADALRARTREPRILRNQDGVEVLKSRGWAKSRSPRPSMTSISISVGWTAKGSRVSVLSLLGSFCWVEAQPLEVSGPLCRHRQRRAFRDLPEASRPLRRLRRAAADGHVRRRRRVRAGARAAGHDRRAAAGQLPSSRARTPRAMRPLLEVANRHRAMLFIHHGPRPGDAFPKVGGRHGQCAPPQRHARHAGEPVLGDGDAVPHRLPRALPGRDGPRPQPRRQHSLRGRAHGPPLPARHAEGGAAVVALPQARRCTWIATRSARARSRRRCACTAPSASCAAPTAPRSASTGPRRRSRKRRSARRRASRSCTGNAAAMLARVGTIAQRATAAA